MRDRIAGWHRCGRMIIVRYDVHPPVERCRLRDDPARARAAGAACRAGRGAWLLVAAAAYAGHEVALQTGMARACAKRPQHRLDMLRHPASTPISPASTTCRRCSR